MRTSSIIDPPIVKFKEKIKNIKFSKKVIDLSQAVPSYPMPDVIKDKLNTDYSFYTPDQGILELRTEISKLYSGIINPDEVLITAGANQGAFNVFCALLNSGDSIALPLPCYFNYDMSVKMLGAKPIYYKLKKENSYKFYFKDLNKEIFEKCKAIVLINPNNPTGAEYDMEEIVKLYNECKKHNMYLIIDEAYGFFSKKGYPESSALYNLKKLDNLILINTFSKTFSLTGYRVGFVVAKEYLMKEFIKVQDSVVICAPRISQYAALYGLQYAKTWLSQKVKLINSNVEFFKDNFSKIRKFKLLSAGTFFSYIEHPYKDSYTASIKLAEDISVLTLPGQIFDEKDKKTIRMAFGNISKDEISELINRLSILNT